MIEIYKQIRYKLDASMKEYRDNNPIDINHVVENFKESDEKLKQKHNVTFNIEENEPCMFDVYNKKIKTDGICQTLTESHHNTIRLIYGNDKVRKLSPTEHFRLMGFTDNEIKSFASMSIQSRQRW